MVGVSFRLQKLAVRRWGPSVERPQAIPRGMQADANEKEKGDITTQGELGSTEPLQSEKVLVANEEGNASDGGVNGQRPRSSSRESTQPLGNGAVSPPKGERPSTKRKRNDQILKGHKSLRSFLRAARATRAPGGAFLLDHLPDLPASFAVNLLPSEFSLDAPIEKDGKHPPLKTVSKLPAYPINRTTEPFLTALDRGCIPCDMLSELPCTYIDGCLIVELRDYRASAVRSSAAGTPKGIPRPPVVHKLLLRPDTECVIKETAKLSKEGKLNYQEQLEVEAGALRAVQPDLCLDPNPKTLARSAAGGFACSKMAFGCRPGGLRYKGSITARRVQALRSARERRALLGGDQTLEDRKLPFPPELVELSVEDLMGARLGKSTDRVPSPVAEDKPIASIRSSSKKSLQKGQRALAAAAAAVAAQNSIAAKADKWARDAEEAQAAEESRVLVKALDLVKDEEGRPGVPAGGTKRKTMEEIREERARMKKQKQEEKEQAKEMRAKEKEEQKERKNQERLQKQKQKQTFASADKERREKEARDKVEAAERAREAEEERLEAEKKQKEEEERERAAKAAKEEEERKKRERLAKEALAKIREVPKTAKQLKEEAKERDKEAKRKKRLEEKAAKEAERKRLLEETKAKDAAAIMARTVGKSPSFSGQQVKGEPSEEARLGPRPGAPPAAGLLDGHVSEDDRKLKVDTRAVLLQLIRKHDLQPKPPKVDPVIRPSGAPASRREVQVALAQADATKDVADPTMARAMATSLVGGSVNARKNRIVHFVKAEARPAPGTKGPPTMVVYRRLRLLLIGRPQDTMVQAVMQVSGDEADEDPQLPGSANRNIVLPLLPSQEAADAFAAELTRLLKNEGHQLYSDEIVPMGHRQQMGPPLGMNGQNRAMPMPVAGALAAAGGGLGPMAMPGGMRLPSPGLPLPLPSPTGHPPSRIFPTPPNRNHLLARGAPDPSSAQIGTPVPGSPQLGPLTHMSASQMAQRVISSTHHGAHVGAQLVSGHPAPMAHQHPQQVLQQQLQQQQVGLRMQHRQAQQQMAAQAGVQQRHHLQQRQAQQQQQLQQMQQAAQQQQQVAHQQQQQAQMQNQLKQRQILAQQQQQAQQIQRSTLQTAQQQQQPRQQVPGTPQTPGGGVNLQAGRGGGRGPTLKQAQMLQQQQAQAKQKQMAAALARSQSGGTGQGQNIPPQQVLMSPSGEMPVGSHQMRLAQQQQMVQQQRLQQMRAQQMQQQQQQQQGGGKPAQGLPAGGNSGQLQSPPSQAGQNKPPTKQQAAQLKRQLSSQQQASGQSDQSQQQQMFQRQLSQGQMGSPGAQASAQPAMAGRATNPQMQQHLAATGNRPMPSAQQMQQRPQPGQQPGPPQLQIPPIQTQLPGPETGAGNGASQPLPSPKVNLQQQQLRNYMQGLPPEKRQEVWQQIQARNAAARSNAAAAAAAQAAAVAGAMSPGMVAVGQNPQGMVHGPGGVTSPIGRGAGSAQQVGAGRGGRSGPAGRGRGVQMPGNAPPLQSSAQLVAAAGGSQRSPLAGSQEDNSSVLRENPLSSPLQDGMASPSAGGPSPGSYPYTLQQAQMSAMMQNSGVPPVSPLGSQGVAPPIGAPPKGNDGSGRSPMQPGQPSQPPDK